jgi:hypothetical protein
MVAIFGQLVPALPPHGATEAAFRAACGKVVKPKRIHGFSQPAEGPVIHEPSPV